MPIRFQRTRLLVSCVFLWSAVLLHPASAMPLDQDGDGFDETVDCDDLMASINPLADEVCDGVDNNCNAIVDEGWKLLWWQDNDGDGFGDPIEKLVSCAPPKGMVPNRDDCNDADPTINPAALEICDGMDNNCNFASDEGCDGDTAEPSDLEDTAAPKDTGSPTDTGAAAVGDTDTGDAGENEGGTLEEEADTDADPEDEEKECGGSMFVLMPLVLIGIRRGSSG